MSAYELIEENDRYEIGRRDGMIQAACVCGSGLVVTDKGLGRAEVATWKTRHRTAGPRLDGYSWLLRMLLSVSAARGPRTSLGPLTPPL